MNLEPKKPKKTLFSIIIPMKNADRYIRSALESINENKFDDIEVLVIDDNSDNTDISKYLVQSWKNQHPNIKLKIFKTTKDNGGPGGARNIGLDNATGRYILFLDADDVLTNNALKSIKSAIDENPNTDIFVLGYQLTRRDSYENDKKSNKFFAGKIQETRLFQIGVNTAGQIWNTCIKRELFGGKDDKNNIRFKPNCKFEDLATKVCLFVRNKTKIKSVSTITHTQHSRINKSVTGTLLLSDMKRLKEAHDEIADIKNVEPNVNINDKAYLNARKVSFFIVAGWLIQKAFRNNLDRKMQQKKEKRQALKDAIALGM